MNKNKLKKQIDKYYYAHDQHLIIDTVEMFQNSEQDCIFDVYLADSNIFLFTIQNYNGLKDLDVRLKTYFAPEKYKVVEVWDSVKASCIPLYG